MNYNVVNPNTYITIDKKKNVNSFWEKIFVDVYIAGYDDDVLDVLNANAYDDVVNSNSGLISTEIGNHYIARDGSGYIVPQTYIMTDDGKMYIGRKDLTSVSSIIQLAAVDDVNIGSDSVEQVDEYEVPVGTMYRVDFSANKQYREEYIQYGIGDFREAQENPEDNMVKIENLRGTNPKTGLFYTVAPFVVVICVAALGILIIKKLSKDDD